MSMETDNNKEILFAKTLEEVRRLAKEQGNCISRRQIEDAFARMKLEAGQIDLIEDYLKKHRIGIGELVKPEDYLTKEEVSYLDTYLEELEQFTGLRDGEKEAVTLSAMAGDTQAQAKLMEIYLPQVAEIAKLYSGQGVCLEDLIGEGNVAVAMGVTMLGCLEHAKEAEGMLGKMIMDAMEEAIHDSLQEFQKDKKVLDRVNKVSDMAKELAEALLRKVTVEELAAETELPEEVIREAVRMSGGNIEYIEKE